jgi:hypothetical protein
MMILIPELGPAGDEAAHQFHAGCIMQDVHLYAAGAQQIFLAQDGPIFADHDFRNTSVFT